MAYWVSNLKNIPTCFDWYFFLVGDYRNHSPINDFFRDDFSIIADRLNGDTAFVAQNSRLEYDLQESLKNVENGKLGSMISTLEKRHPGLLIINKHPRLLDHFSEMMDETIKTIPDDWEESQKQEYLTDFYNKNHGHTELQEDTKIIFIPFTSIEKAYTSTNSLIADLVAFSNGDSKDFIKNTSRGGFIHRKISTSVSLNLGIVAINFNFD